MNPTVKSIILVIVITSMLFVGTTSMFSIMQNSFASKKFDVKQADRNANTNINSADSTSSSTATASNTNNINNSACTVTISTCHKGSTTVTSTPPPIAGCPAGTLYDVTTTIKSVELCLPGHGPGRSPLGAQTATIAGLNLNLHVVIANPNTASCAGSIRAEVTSGRENVPGLNTVCVLQQAT
jgi:hypothetical protein